MKRYLGIELGSTRIKAVLIDESSMPIAIGVFNWENELRNKIWTYPLEKVWLGIAECFLDLKQNYFSIFNEKLDRIDAIGVSAMMHGYLAFDKNDTLLVPFRTWRNTITQEAARDLTQKFDFNIPQRWSIAHFYQDILNQESHINQVEYLTTLSGYVHWKLTGEKVLGIGDASGMFPIDPDRLDYKQTFVEKFNGILQEKGIGKDIKKLLPKILVAGSKAGTLTKEGALLIDPTGQLKAGIPLCAPEGDAGTGMVATNSIAIHTGNVSVGTSVFAMIVLENSLSQLYEEIDIVSTPDGKNVAMIHANNGASDIQSWVGIFSEFVKLFDLNISESDIFEKLFVNTLNSDRNCGNILSYGYLSGEHFTNISDGSPLIVRQPDSNFNLANLFKSHIYSIFGVMHLGMNLLREKEKVVVEQLWGHGGVFKTKLIAQKALAEAMGTKVSVMNTASEGGAWGIALLAYHMYSFKELSLDEFLKTKVFDDLKAEHYHPTKEGIDDYKQYGERYRKGLEIVRKAIYNLND